MRVTYEWNRTSLDAPYGFRIRVNPKCRMRLGYLGAEPPCDQPATVRRTYKRGWSLMWCPAHAAMFHDYGPSLVAFLFPFIQPKKRGAP